MCKWLLLIRLLLVAYGPPSLSSNSSVTSTNYKKENNNNNNVINGASSVSASSCTDDRPIHEVASLLQTTQSTESDLDMTMSLNDAIMHVTQELFPLTPGTLMEMAVLNSVIKTKIADRHESVTLQNSLNLLG